MFHNAAAQMLTRTKKLDHIPPVLSCLDWIPVKFHIGYEIHLINYKALNGPLPLLGIHRQSQCLSLGLKPTYLLSLLISLSN